MGETNVNRRDFLKGATASVAGAAAFGVIRSKTRAAEQELVIVGWGGSYEDSMKEAFFDPFTKATGIRIRQVSAVGQQFAQLKAQVQNNNPEYDICTFGNAWLLRGAKEGLLAPIDYKIVDSGGLYKEALHPFGVAYEIFAIAMAFNTEKFPAGKHPKTWAEYWDVKRFPGRRTAPGWSPRNNLEAALIADGVPMNKVYPIAVDRALKRLAEMKPHTTWYSTGAQLAQFFTDREVVLGYGWSGRIEVIAQQGVPVATELNQAILDQTYWVVSKVSRNKEAALRFINFASQAGPQAKRPELHPYGPVSREAWGRLSPALRAKLPNYERPNTIFLNGEWWVDNDEKVVERWKVWLAS